MLAFVVVAAAAGRLVVDEALALIGDDRYRADKRVGVLERVNAQQGGAGRTSPYACERPSGIVGHWYDCFRDLCSQRLDAVYNVGHRFSL